MKRKRVEELRKGFRTCVNDDPAPLLAKLNTVTLLGVINSLKSKTIERDE